jgi:Kinesin motor domain
VPKAAEEIFERIEKEKSDKIHREVTISMMEIYNEKVHDLLMPMSSRDEVSL